LRIQPDDLAGIDLSEPEVPLSIEFEVLGSGVVSMDLFERVGREVLSGRIEASNIICCSLGELDIPLRIDGYRHDIILAMRWGPGGDGARLWIETCERIGEHLAKPDIPGTIYRRLQRSRIGLWERIVVGLGSDDRRGESR
jgi:hypothetical protein